MSKVVGLCMGSAMLLLAGCSSTHAPLIFGDITTFGLRLGSDGSTGGGSVAIGFKAQSIAIVPVTYLDEKGWIRYLNGYGFGTEGDEGDRDGMSVFASFESRAPASDTVTRSSSVKLGQVFSTGLAAQQVTLGYLCREESLGQECKNERAKLVNSAVATAERKRKTEEKKNEHDAAEEKNRLLIASDNLQVAAPNSESSPPKKDPYQAPLLFARTDVIGIDIGGSLAQQGLQFVLGYTGRNLALIPTTAHSAHGKVLPIMGADRTGDGRSLDAFSVMGQFHANSETDRLGFGLERYFATGLAARNIGQSVGAAIASSGPPPAKAAGTTTSVAASSK